MKAFALAIVLTIPLPFAACSLGQKHQTVSDKDAQSGALSAADAAFRDGLEASGRNDFVAARVSFEKTVRLAPQVAAGHAALGSVLLALEDITDALQELEAAHRLDSSDHSTMLNLCVAYSKNHDYPKTIATYHEFEGSSTALPADVAIAVAIAFSATGNNSAAQGILQLAIRSDESNPLLQDAFGTILALEKDFSSAEMHFRRAIALDPKLSSAHYHLGSLESATGRMSDAIGELDLAHNLDPTNVNYSLDLARVQVLNNQEIQAIDLLRATLTKIPSSSSGQSIDVKYRLAIALQAAGKVKDAMPLFADVIAARPEDAEALTNTALAHVQLGDAKGGIAIYLRALTLTPSNPTLREDLGVAYLQQADLDHALEQFRAGLLIDDQSAQLHYDLALALKLKDDLAAAIPEFERAAALDPQLSDPPFTLGIIYMQQGKFEKSAASFETALALRPNNGEAWATLGSVYQQMQLPDKAVPALRRAIDLMPQQPSPHITLAAVLAAQGKKEEAATERKTGAALSRAVNNRQKANFGLDSGTLLMSRGQTADALVQFENAVEADPNYAAPHAALAGALDRAGRKAEAAEERHKAAELEAKVQ